MATPTTPTVADWTWPTPVLAFAAEHGLTPYLEPVLEMTRRAFPGRPITAEMTADYEIPDERYVAVWVDVTGLTADQLGDQSDRWYSGLREICGRDREERFYLGMEGS